MTTNCYLMIAVDERLLHKVEFRTKASTSKGLFSSACRAFSYSKDLPDGKYLLSTWDGKKLMFLLLHRNDWKMILEDYTDEFFN